MSTSRQVRLARRPEGEPTDDTFAFEEHELPDLEDGQLLLRVVYLSLDPYMRGRLSDAPSYADPVEIGEVIVGGTVCVVEESRDPSYDVGDVVLSYSGWQTHAIADAGHVRKLDPSQRTDLDGARGPRHARVHGVRRTARDRQAATRRDRRGRGGHRPGRIGGGPDREGQGCPRRRDRRRREEAAGTARRVRLRRRPRPPLPHVRRRPGRGRARRDRRLLRERRRTGDARGPAAREPLRPDAGLRPGGGLQRRRARPRAATGCPGSCDWCSPRACRCAASSRASS